MARGMYRTRTAYHNKAAIYIVCVLVMVIALVVAVNCSTLEAKRAEYQAQLENLETQLEEENNRLAELEEYEKYTDTLKFAEETAKEKLGMVYEDEIIFKDND